MEVFKTLHSGWSPGVHRRPTPTPRSSAKYPSYPLLVKQAKIEKSRPKTPFWTEMSTIAESELVNAMTRQEDASAGTQGCPGQDRGRPGRRVVAVTLAARRQSARGLQGGDGGRQPASPPELARDRYGLRRSAWPTSKNQRPVCRTHDPGVAWRTSGLVEAHPHVRPQPPPARLAAVPAVRGRADLRCWPTRPGARSTPA